MKSTIWCTCVIAMLVVSTVARGEIVFDEDEDESTYGLGDVSGNSGHHTATGYANGDNGWGVGYGEGWQSYYTTVAGNFEWWYYIKTKTTADLSLSTYFEACYACGDGDAYASCLTYSDSLSAYAYVDFSYYNGTSWWLHDEDDGGEPTGIYLTHRSSFDPDEGVYAEHTAIAHTGVGQDSDETGWSEANVWAICNMYAY